MGNFYTNFTIFGRDAASVMAAAKELARTAYVVDSAKNATVLFDKACDNQDTDEIERLGADLSARLDAPVLACLNHDDDHLLLWVHNQGKRFAYQSCFDAADFAWALCRVRGGVFAYPFLFVVLSWPIVLLQVFRHTILRSLLSLPHASVGFGYTYLHRGELPPGISREDLRSV